MKTKLKFLTIAIAASLPFFVLSALRHNPAVVITVYATIWGTMALMVAVLPLQKSK